MILKLREAGQMLDDLQSLKEMRAMVGLAIASLERVQPLLQLWRSEYTPQSEAVAPPEPPAVDPDANGSGYTGNPWQGGQPDSPITCELVTSLPAR